MSQELADLLKRYGLLLTLLGAFLSGFLSPIGLDNLVSAYAFLSAALVFAVARWRVWVTPRQYQGYSWLLKGLTLLFIVAVAAGWGYFLWWASNPHFEIRALDTLEGDRNAYEVTDQLLWNYDRQDEYGATMTFTLEIVPRYTGKREFGSVVALISGDGHKGYEKELWPHFDEAASTRQIELTLEELAKASGVERNSDPPVNRLRTGDPVFQEATLQVQITQAAAKGRPWAREQIVIRNTPWDIQSALVERDGQRAVDVLVKNLGATGEFTVRYRLGRLEKEIDTSSSRPEVSGVTTLTCWNEPDELARLETGKFFTDTVFLPEELAQGRYLVEIYAVKKQHYVEFADPSATWSSLNSLNSPWWFGGYPSGKHLFVVTTPEFPTDAIVQAESDRLRKEEGIDLGVALEPAEEVTSASKAVGLRQVFEQGEIYVHEDDAYALYGPILEYYRQWGGHEYIRLGFPISRIQAVTSSSGQEGYMAEFEGPGPPHASTRVYSSEDGVAGVWMFIRWVYSEVNGGHSEWLGFPLADEQYFEDSTVQMFEHGYIVYQFPYVGEYRDWARMPVAHPYLSSDGILLDVHADRQWQDSGVQVHSGDRVTIIQVDGEWTNGGASVEWVDANGNLKEEPQEDALLESAAIGALVGRIGQAEEPFLVGRWGILEAEETGTLYLAMNDNSYASNDGFITVEIAVEK